MAKPAVAAGALLSTVTNTAQTLSNIVNTVNNAVSIGNGFVERHLIMQSDKNIVELKNARVRLIEDTALEMAEHRQAISLKLKDENFKKSFEEAHNSLAALFPEDQAA